jgi:hypothetical protein
MGCAMGGWQVGEYATASAEGLLPVLWRSCALRAPACRSEGGCRQPQCTLCTVTACSPHRCIHFAAALVAQHASMQWHTTSTEWKTSSLARSTLTHLS